MAFQSNVRQFMTSGVVGEVILDGAIRSRGVILNSANEANNVVGRALTYSNANADGVRVEAGGTGVFAGILTHSKQYAALGTQAGGALAPTLTIPNNSQVEATYFATGVYVELSCNQSQAINIGDKVAFNQTNGVLIAFPANQNAPVGHTEIVGARVIEQNVVGPTTQPYSVLAVIELNS